MGNQYKQFRVPATAVFETYELTPSGILGDLSTINCFVGANNSGKSRLLRELFRGLPFGFTTHDYSSRRLYDVLKAHEPDFQAICKQFKLRELDHLTPGWMTTQGKELESGFLQPNMTVLKNVIGVVRKLAQGSGIHYENTPYLMQKRDVDCPVAVRSWAEKLLADMEALPALDDSSIHGLFHIYCPVLRGMRPFGDEAIDYYANRTRDDYFPSKEGTNALPDTKVIFTGHTLYTFLQENLLGDPQQRALVRSFEEYLSIAFFGSEPVSLIPHLKYDTVHIKIGTGEQRPIYDHGDGIQTIVNLTFHMFMNEQRCLFFIEEPETHLHPGFQRALISAMRQRSQHQYFVTTHSNHILDVASEGGDSSVFRFSPSSDSTRPFRVTRCPNRDRETLSELGVRSSSVFLANATIWVEGITDRRYLRALMERFLKQPSSESLPPSYKGFQEDIHYCFVEYHGSVLGHWIFGDDSRSDDKVISAIRICGAPFVVADGDIRSKGERASKLSSQLPEAHFILPCKEIENMLPEALIRDYANDHTPESDVSRISEVDYQAQDTPLGRYLDETLGVKLFAEDSGTIKEKVTLCDFAVDWIRRQPATWSLPKIATEICDKVFHHIATNQ